MTSPTAASASALVRERFGVEPADDGRGGLAVPLAPDQWQPFGAFARAELGCGYFAFLTAVDWKEEGADVVCRVENVEARLAVTMRTRLAAGTWRCASLTGVWRGADWMERECYDMFGIVFEGHPDLRRILLAQDWEGHPLRKDYAVDTPHTPYR